MRMKPNEHLFFPSSFSPDPGPSSFRGQTSLELATSEKNKRFVGSFPLALSQVTDEKPTLE